MCLTLCDSMDSRPPDTTVHGISQARILEWLAISFPRGSSQPRNWICISHIGGWILYHWFTSEASLMMPHAKSLLFIHTWERNFSSIVACVHHYLERCKRAKLLLSRLTLCNPMGCRPSGSFVPGVLQAIILEWPASSSRVSSWPKDRILVSYISCISRWVLYH